LRHAELVAVYLAAWADPAPTMWSSRPSPNSVACLGSGSGQPRSWPRLGRAGRLDRSDRAQERVAHGPAGWAVEGDVGPQRRRQAADALAAPSRRQEERLELAPRLIGLAVGEDERGAPGWLEASV
jgi:hypothetical protein